MTAVKVWNGSEIGVLAWVKILGWFGAKVPVGVANGIRNGVWVESEIKVGVGIMVRGGILGEEK